MYNVCLSAPCIENIHGIIKRNTVHSPFLLYYNVLYCFQLFTEDGRVSSSVKNLRR